MKICISSGHGKYIRGASGSPVPPQLDEVNEARRVVERVAEFLRTADVGVETFHDNTSHDQSTNLATITNWHNSKTRDLDVSVHFNAFDHSAHGCEVLYVSQESLAAKVSSALAAAGGFTNRGAKYRSDLYVLNNTEEPAILIETCFCDNTSDSNLYNSRFDAICKAIAESLSGRDIGEPPDAEERPPIQRPPIGQPPPTTSSRPTIGRGDSGSHVVTVQQCLEITADGDFGQITEQAVADYQRSKQIQADGIVGPQTWSWLEDEFNLPPYPPQMLPPLDGEQTAEICAIAADSKIASYNWRDRGTAPLGYIQGMAFAFADIVRRFNVGDTGAIEVAKANTGNADKDVLAWYAAEYTALHMANDRPGLDTLRHLYALMIGLSMRESSGQHCCGRDMSAENVTSETAEAGLFQMSWNASSCSDEMQKFFDEYNACPSPQCGKEIFSKGVSCSSSDWQNYGSGDGEHYQMMAKNCPVFAVHTAAICLRKLRQHFGPINRKEAELKGDADAMLLDVQTYVMDQNIA